MASLSISFSAAAECFFCVFLRQNLVHYLNYWEILRRLFLMDGLKGSGLMWGVEKFDGIFKKQMEKKEF